jgi:hypothetical protein
MSTYKITNITDKLHKRDVHFKTPVKIQYIDNRMKKVSEVKTGESLFLTVDTLPLSIHRLRVKGLVDVVDASVAEIKKMKAPASPKKKVAPKAKKEAEPKKTETKKASTSKSSTAKKRTSTKSTSTKADLTEKEPTT